MAIINCKNCGGSIELSEDKTFGTCEFCGSTMTFPKVDDDQRAAAFNRGNHFRRIGEFDKALAVYERIVEEDNTDAEAHWCCALCRFGIEYVEDPATYEWLPTCHRASFDSFLEDVDYKAALEYSDGVTRRQYMKDAAKIAEVQKGILATSQNADPYDVFICYKESDEDGERTRDSILAQEIYYQLTGQGRKVFFSRITLEDRVGTEYEPYIFAALNSARIMVVVGTKPEYLNAVWVKNEWSRFLAMMKQDRTKLLLPCYRDMDPYDLPEQLSVLQSYDMEKISFMSDLTHGIARVLDAEKKGSQPDTVVVQQASGNVTALLKRGNMALEDGEWETADEFFEEVLNQDAECAEAYVGKTLAMMKCASLEAFLRKHLEATLAVKSVQRQIPVDQAHVREMVEKYAIPHRLEEGAIRELYVCSREYPSSVDHRRQQREAEETFWSSHKYLSRAVKFAKGETAAKLVEIKAKAFKAMEHRVEQAEQAEAEAKKRCEEAYAAHLAKADHQAELRFTRIRTDQEIQYQKLCGEMAQADMSGTCNHLARAFDELYGYKDSEELAAQLREKAKRLAAQEARAKAEKEAEDRRILAEREAERKRLDAERRAKLEEEAERQRQIAARLEAQRRSRNKRNAIIALIVAIVVIIAAVVVTQVVIPNSKRSQAQELMAAGSYQEAYAILKDMGDDESAALLREVKRHGNYLPTSMGDYTYIFNEHGHPHQILSGGDVQFAFTYTYYDSGNLASALLCNSSGERAYEFTFYDTEEATVVFYPGAVTTICVADIAMQTKVRNFDFRGISSRSEYDTYEDNNPLKYTTTYDEEGYPVRTDYADGDYLEFTRSGSTLKCTPVGDFEEDRTYTIKLDSYGNIAKLSYSYYDYIYEYEYFGTQGEFTEMVVWDDEDKEYPAHRKFVNTYDETGLMTHYKVYSASKGSQKLGYSEDIVMSWVNYSDLAAAMEAEQAELQEAYDTAEALMAEGDYMAAALAFQALGEAGRVEECMALLKEVQEEMMTSLGRSTFALGDYHALKLGAGGTVVTAGADTASYGQCDVTGWTDIVSVAAGSCYSVGLKSDGTVVATGYNKDGQCDVSGWSDIVAIAAGPAHTIGLKRDGTVVAAGYNGYDQCDVSDWTDIVAIATGAYHTVGLKSDGTVVTAGNNDFDQCDTYSWDGWEDIVAIAAGQANTYGLKADGTVVATGTNDDGRCDVEDLKNIVSIDACNGHFVALKADGTAVGLGWNEYGQCDVDGIDGIVGVDASFYATLVMLSDGSYQIIGDDMEDTIDVSGWAN